jgi:hypothetical protein
MMWGDQRVAEQFLSPGKAASFTVGNAPGVSFATGGPLFEVVHADERGFHLRFSKKMRGEVCFRGEMFSLIEAIERGMVAHDGEAYALCLDDADFAQLELGGVTLQAHFAVAPKPVVDKPWERIDHTALNVFLATFFVAAVFVVTMATSDAFADPLDGDSPSSSTVEIVKRRVAFAEAPEIEKITRPDAASAHEGPEGKRGTPKAKDPDRRGANKGNPNDPNRGRELARNLLGGGVLGGMFEPGNPGAGGELKIALGGLKGRRLGDATGRLDGLGFKELGDGGGGLDPVSIGALVTRGHHGLCCSDIPGVGFLKKGDKPPLPQVDGDPPTVGPGIDRELIRRVIHLNIGQVRYCYETELIRKPSLFGKVAVHFVIGPSGTVVTSDVAQSTADDRALESCLAGKVKGWQFPKPKGGGVVVVTYPFVFTTSGK